MKIYTILSKAGIAICIILISLFVFNWFTGYINPKITAGASIICIITLIIVLFSIFNKDYKKNR